MLWGSFPRNDKIGNYLSELVSISVSGILSDRRWGGAGVWSTDTSFGAMRLES